MFHCSILNSFWDMAHFVIFTYYRPVTLTFNWVTLKKFELIAYTLGTLYIKTYIVLLLKSFEIKNSELIQVQFLATLSYNGDLCWKQFFARYIVMVHCIWFKMHMTMAPHETLLCEFFANFHSLFVKTVHENVKKCPTTPC